MLYHINHCFRRGFKDGKPMIQNIIIFELWFFLFLILQLALTHIHMAKYIWYGTLVSSEFWYPAGGYANCLSLNGPHLL